MKTQIRVVYMLIVAVSMVGCSVISPIEPTETSIPPTPTPEILQASLAPFEVDGLQMRIVFVHLGEDEWSRYAPFQLSAGETMLTTRVQPLSAVLTNLTDEERALFRVWVSDENGNVRRLGPVVTTTSTDYIFQFPVPESSETFYLCFPNGDVYDLSPVMP